MTPDKRHIKRAESQRGPKVAPVAIDAENARGRSLFPGSDGGSEREKRQVASRREGRLSDVPAKYRGLYLRAWAGKSRKSAVRAFCLACVCWSEKEVHLCSDPACPLYEFRLKG